MALTRWPYLLFFLLLILITYGNSINNAFLSDDLAEIVNNPNIGNLGYAITTHPFGFIRLIFYWLAFQISGLNPILFRSINIFFHIASVFLIYGLINHLHSKRLALIVTSIFAVHPAISEAVVWISGGTYPQYTFFFLLSFLLYLQSKANLKYYWLSVVAFLFSFMSHPQMPISLFLIFPLYELCFGNLKKNWRKSIPFLILSFFYIFISLGALPERETTLQSTHYQAGGVDNLFVLIPVAITSYFELIFFPITLTLYHSELVFGPINFAVRTLITLTFFAAIFLSLKKNKFIFFWLSLFLIALSPTLTPFRLNWVVAERYLYLPILGILVPFALGLERLSNLIKLKGLSYFIFQRKTVLRFILFFILVILSGRTIIRNIDWKNEDNLWIATGKTSPSSPNTHNNLGDVYGRRGDKQAALQEFLTAIALKPNYGDAYHNAGNTYSELGQLDKALEYYQKAAQLNPNLWQSYQNIAAIYFESAKQASNSAELAQQQYNLALEYLQKAISINPKNLNLRNNLGVVYLAMGSKEKAKEIFNLVLSADPQNQFANAGLLEANK